MAKRRIVTRRRPAGFGLKNGSGRGIGRVGGARRNKTSVCRHPNLKKRRYKWERITRYQ